MNEIITLRDQSQYNLRNWTYFDFPKVRTVNYGSESIRYFDPKIWDIIPTHIKELDTIKKVETRILHCAKYHNFVYFPDVEILWKGTVS